MSTRRESNRSFWLGRVAATAIMVLAGFGVFAGTASAQGTLVYDYDDYEGWWNSYGCTEMKVLLPAYTDTDADAVGDQGETKANHEKRVCVMLDDLSLDDQIIIRDFVLSTMNGPYENNEKWWDAPQTSVHRQQLAAALPLATSKGTLSAGDDPGYDASATAIEAATTGEPTIYNDDYDDLHRTGRVIVDTAGYALSGRGGMAPQPAPALPLVGIGGLGLLLAGRGAWLRRRHNG